MQLPGDMDIRGLALLGGLPSGEGAGLALATRMFDTDGDGRNDLFVVDYDNDGTIDGAVRGLDTDQDGVLDTFIEYDADGEIQAVGRLNPDTKEFEVVEADDFEDTLSSLDLGDVAPPADSLFTTFDDPVFMESFGTLGEEVPEVSEPYAEAEGAEITEVDAAQEPGEPQEDMAEVTPKVVEVEDWSGAGDGSDLHVKIDRDGDGMGEADEKLFRTSDGTWHGDVDKDGYSDEVAFDRDQDGRIESVDTAGKGSTTDTVGAEQVVSPESGNIVDRAPGEDDFRVEDGAAAAADDDAGASAAADDAGAEDDFTVSDADSGSTCDPGSSVDTGSSYGSGSSSSSDAGSTTIDSDGSDDGSTTT